MKGLVQKLGMATAVFAMTSAPIAYADDANTNRAVTTSHKPANDFKATQITEKALPSVQEQIKLLEAQAYNDALKGTPVILINPNQVSKFDRLTVGNYYKDHPEHGVKVVETQGATKLYVPFTTPSVKVVNINDGSNLGNGKVIGYIYQCQNLVIRSQREKQALDNS